MELGIGDCELTLTYHNVIRDVLLRVTFLGPIPEQTQNILKMPSKQLFENKGKIT